MSDSTQPGATGLRPRRRWVQVVTFAGVAMLAAGGGAMLMWPTGSEPGPASTPAAQVQVAPPSPTPALTPSPAPPATEVPAADATITLAQSGGQAELDAAAYGDWTEMLVYRDDPGTDNGADKPVWASHVNRGGDIALDWEVGTIVDVTTRATGETVRMQVVEVLDGVAKEGTPVTVVEDVEGVLVLQTCWPRPNPTMRLTGLAPI